MPGRFGGLLPAVLGAVLVGVSHAQNLKFATMRWRQESVPPDNPKVRFQMTTAWKWSSFEDAGTGCQAQCTNLLGGLNCAKSCTGEGGKAVVGDYVTLYDIYSTAAGVPMNKGVPIMFDFGDASTPLTGERVSVPAGTADRPAPKCRTIGNPNFGQCLEGYVTDVNKDTDTIVVQSDFIRIYPNPGIFVAFFQGCCRPDTLVNNPNSPWRFETTVVLSSNGDDALPNESPAVALVPEITAI